jgi:hypothetical protein
MVTTALAISNNGKAIMIMQLVTAMGLEDKTAHHVHHYSKVVGHVLKTSLFFNA